MYMDTTRLYILAAILCVLLYQIDDLMRHPVPDPMLAAITNQQAKKDRP